MRYAVHKKGILQNDVEAYVVACLPYAKKLKFPYADKYLSESFLNTFFVKGHPIY